MPSSLRRRGLAHPRLPELKLVYLLHGKSCASPLSRRWHPCGPGIRRRWRILPDSRCIRKRALFRKPLRGEWFHTRAEPIPCHRRRKTHASRPSPSRNRSQRRSCLHRLHCRSRSLMNLPFRCPYSRLAQRSLDCRFSGRQR